MSVSGNLRTDGVLNEQISATMSALSNKISSPETAGTAGQVLGLDSNLDPVWTTPASGSDDNKAPVILDTASGAIASFPDGADNLPLQNLTVGIEPVQDLHGQANPYPAGGSANIFDQSVRGMPINLSAGTTLYVKQNGTINFNLYALNESEQSIDLGMIAQNTLVIITLQQNITLLAISQDALNNLTQNGRNIMVSLTSFTDIMPYSNICPISGWTGAVVSRTGKNLVDLSAFEFNNTTYSNSYPTTTIPASRKVVDTLAKFIGETVSYTATVTGSTGTSAQPIGAFRLASNGTLVFQFNPGQTKEIPSFDPSTVTHIFVYGSNNGSQASVSKMMFNIGSPENYEPYNGTTYPISWQTEAGTVYGGSLNGKTGVLTVDRAMYTLIGTESWSRSSTYNGSFYYNTGINHAYVAPVCSHAKTRHPFSGYSFGEMTLDGGKNKNINIWIMPENTTVEQFKAYLAEQNNNGTPVQVVCVLETPQTYQLTPIEIETLLGQNNLWADCGSISVDYCADTKAYVDDAIPAIPVQDVKVNGTSILSQGAANVPIAGQSTLGVVKVGGSGLNIVNGQIITSACSEEESKIGTNGQNPVVPLRQHCAAFYGLAKASGDTTQSSSANAVGTYTEDAKLKIQQMLGLWEPKMYLTGTVEEDSANIQLSNVTPMPINIWEELIIVIYQTIPENDQAIGSNNFGYFTIRDNVNGAYIPSTNYLRGDRPNIYRVKRFPNVLFCELIAGSNSLNTNSKIRTVDYVDKISWIAMAFSNGTIKAGTRVDAYIRKFI